jgi:hypothetical protein
MTTDSLLTPSILSDAEHQEVAALLLSFMQSFSLLLNGLPRTVPHPRLPAAHVTRKRLLDHLYQLTDEALEDAVMQGPLLEARQIVLDGDQVPRNVRTSDLLALLWSINMPHVIAFWMLVRILSTKSLADQIRTETKQYVKAVQDVPVMGFSVPPRVSIDPIGLLQVCPVLMSCFIETVRLYSRGWRAGVVSKDFEVGGEEAKVFKTEDKWGFQKGEWVDTPFWLSHTDFASYVDAEKWDYERHLVSEASGEQTAEWKAVSSDCEQKLYEVQWEYI